MWFGQSAQTQWQRWRLCASPIPPWQQHLRVIWPSHDTVTLHYALIGKDLVCMQLQLIARSHDHIKYVIWLVSDKYTNHMTPIWYTHHHYVNNYKEYEYNTLDPKNINAIPYYNYCLTQNKVMGLVNFTYPQLRILRVRRLNHWLREGTWPPLPPPPAAPEQLPGQTRGRRLPKESGETPQWPWTQTEFEGRIIFGT